MLKAVNNPNAPAISLMLVYEPATSKRGPVPIARVADTALSVMVARAAIAQADAHASELSAIDAYLGELEQAEAQRLRQVLLLLLPALRSSSLPDYPTTRVA